MSAYNAMNAAVFSRLASDGSLGTLLGGSHVYYQQAPEGQAYPYAVWSWQAGGDDNETPNRSKQMVMYLRAYSTTGPANAGVIDARLDALAHDYTFTVVGWDNFWTMREEDIALVETPEDGEPVYNAGGMYRVRLG